MAKSADPSVVCVINTSPDTVEMLRLTFQQAGFVVVSAYTFDIREGRIDLRAFLEQHHPQAIVYDIAPPYDANVQLFRHLRSTTGMAHGQFVVTSTNAAHVAKLMGQEHVY